MSSDNLHRVVRCYNDHILQIPIMYITSDLSRHREPLWMNHESWYGVS